MMIERRNGYVYVPLDSWLLFFVFGVFTSLLFAKEAWAALAQVVALCVVAGVFAIDGTYSVTRGRNNTLTVRHGWRRRQVELDGASVVVEHAFRSFYRVVLSGGTKLSGEMLLGRCIRVAGRIAATLNTPLNVSRELQAELERVRRTVVWIVLFPIGMAVLGSVLWLLSRR